MKAINKKLLDLAEDGNAEEIKRIENFKHIDWASLRKDNTSLLTLFIELDSNSLYYMKKCLDAGIDVNHQNVQGTTALHIAALSNKPELVDFLIVKEAVYDIESYASIVVMKQLLSQKSELMIYKLLEIVDDYPKFKTNLNSLSDITQSLDYLDEIKQKLELMKKMKDDLPEKIELIRKNKI